MMDIRKSWINDNFLYSGEYLALTGEKLNGAEMMACGLATHYSLKEVSTTAGLQLIYLFSLTLKESLLIRLPFTETSLD